MNYRVVPMPYSLVKKARETRMSPQYKGLPAFSAVATGYGPCRSCLKTFDKGKEERLYLAYDPFEGLSDLPMPGHIFIHTDHCDEFNGEGIPHDLRDLPLLFEGYAERSYMTRREEVNKSDTDTQIRDMFSDPSIKFINIRNAEAGCFIARIDRA